MALTNQYQPQPAYNFGNPGVFTKFVSNEQDAYSNIPIPQTGCSFGVDGENMVFYARYSDGRMEVYDMVLREPPKQPEPITAEMLSQILDQKLNDFEANLSKKFIAKKENYQNKGGNLNG